ncbi:MAG: YjdF family protein [Firmicutes bacterium]|nr:YjdF family protein [Bacillota bacterium]
MNESSVSLTVFFEEPFWVGVFERVSGGRLYVCKVTFGARPGDAEVWEFILRHYGKLEFSPAVTAARRPAAVNPKRRLRQAAQMLGRSGIGTRSQQALQLQREEKKTQRQQVRREQREAEKQRQFQLKQQKRREKHRGH